MIQGLNNSSTNLLPQGPKTMMESRNANKSQVPLKKTMATKSSLDLFQNKFEYISDPYDRQEELRKLEFKQNRDRIIDNSRVSPIRSQKNGYF